MSALFRFPRPRSFLHLIPLRTATEFILFLAAINKVTGLYGILAIFTGYHLNPLQLSHYLYSVAIRLLLAWLHPAIRRRDASGILKVLALAWIYVLDTIINAVYTALFGLGWFVLLARHLGETPPAAGLLPGGEKLAQGTMNETAGFTSPELEVSKVDIVASPSPDVVAGQQATMYASGGTLQGVVMEKDSFASIILIGTLWIVRVYFCLIILSYARSTLRQHVAATSASSATYSTTSDPTMAENPFRATGGWQGKLGRFMTRFPTARYWLGKDESEEEWAKGVDSRLERARGLRIKVPGEVGVSERERRARSGTGPPPVPAAIKEKGTLP